MSDSIRPQAGRQEQFLSTPADIAIYGGSAGGGKTWSLLIEPLRHMSNGNFGAVIFRRSYPEITNEGGLWDESKRIYSQLNGRDVKGDLYWRFPSGMRVSFAHLQHEDTVTDWRGAQIALIEFDQLETFTQHQFFYMLSRNRTMCGVRPYIRASCNPEPGWLADFLSWWIAEDGYADLSRAGQVRWMVRRGDDLYWGDSRDEIETRFGVDCGALSVTFIPATVFDNKVLLASNPGYLANLRSLPLVDRERLLGDSARGGNWKIKPAAGKVFNRAWFRVADSIPAGGVVCRRWDFAATEKQLNKSDPDYTASCLMLKADGVFYVLDVTAEQLPPSKIDSYYENITRQDAARCKLEKRQYLSRWEQEPGSAGKRESWRMTKRMAGIDAKGIASNQDKLVRAKPLATQTETGNVYLLPGAWNERFLTHMHGQPELPHDDIMDAAAGAFEDLTHAVVRSANSYQG